MSQKLDRIQKEQDSVPVNLERREALKHLILSGAAVAFELMPSVKALAQVSGSERSLPSLLLGSDVSYDRKEVQKILDSSKTTGQLTDADLGHILKFAQKIQFDLSGNTFQDEMRRRFPDLHKDIRVAITSDRQIIGAKAGRFFHNTNEPSIAFLGNELSTSSAIVVALHELTHAGFGRGETVPMYFETVAGMYVYSKGLVDNPERLITDGRLLSLWDPSKREAFFSRRVDILKRGAVFQGDLEYSILPMYLFGVARGIRLSDKTDHEPYSLMRLMTRAAQEGLNFSFRTEFTLAADKEKFLRTVVNEFVKESVYLMKKFNPQFVVPNHLKAFDQN